MAALWLLLILYVAAEAISLRELGSFHVRQPAFCTLNTNAGAQTASQRYNLLVSTFAAFGTDSVELVRDVGSQLTNVGVIKPDVLTTHVTWPNEVMAVPDGVFPNKEVIAIPDGFLVPFKTAGSIKLMDLTNQQKHGPYTITSSHDGSWFYHRVHWHDMDGDGDQDIVTCRAREPVFLGSKDEELIWLENPGGNIQTTWTTHVLEHGPDTFFRFVQLNTAEGVKDVIVAAQFFKKSLTVYWTTQANGLFTDQTKISKRVIDDTIGHVFEVDLVDLNKDGRLDLLVTTNSMNGTVLAFEVPDDFRTGTFVKHTLAVGFVPRSHGIGKGAPGSAFPIQPVTSVANKKPLILVSGDDDGRAYFLEPSSEGPADWTYTKHAFADVGHSTVGQIAAADVNGDGYVDVFVPAYYQNKIHVYTFAPDTGGVVVG